MTNIGTTLANRILIGGPGTGKTTLIDTLVEDLTGDIRWVDGANRNADARIREVDRELGERQAQESADAPVIHLIVDDASQLDDASVTRLVRIATEGTEVAIFVNIATEEDERFAPFTEPGVARFLRLNPTWTDGSPFFLAA